MTQSCENVIPTLGDFFSSQKAGEEDELMLYRVLNSSCKSIPPRPTKFGNKAKERQSHGSKERSRRNASDAEKFSVEQYSSGGFFGNKNGRQQQRSSPFMPSSKGSNESSSTSWFKKLSNPFSNRNPKSGEIKMNGGETLSFRKSSPVHLHAHLSKEYELGMPVFTFSLDRPDDVYMATTRRDDNDCGLVYSFRYIGGRSNKNLGDQRSNVSGIESSLIGQMQVSTQICLEQEPYEDPVESTASEFLLFDIARARRRQNSFRRGLDPSQSIYSETENRVSNGSNLRQEKLPLPRQKHSDPWPASALHPGLEIAAIVIRDSSSSSNENFGYMKNSKLSRRERKVIVPTGNHGLPDAENSCPTPLLQRWRSGGGCDCSGWDMGCHLFVLESPDTHFAEEPQLINNHHGLQLFIEGEKEITPAMSVSCIREGHYEVNFHAKLSALQAFSVCVAELHRSEVSGGERSNSLSRCSSLRELIGMETPVTREARDEVVSSFMPNVTFSPISRV